MKQCLMTGAGGLIGSQLLTELVKSEWQVHAISRRERDPGTKAGVIWHVLDLAGDWDESALPPEIDAVVHLAQSEHYREFPARARHIFDVNTLAVVRLMEYARRAGAERFVFGSSGGVYGSGEAHFSEDVQIPAQGNLGFYLATKLCSEILLENYVAILDVVILRFFFVYGAAQRRSMLIPRLVDSVREGAPIKLQGNDGLRLNPIHVSDAARATARALGLVGGHKINVAGPEVLTLRQVADVIGRVVGREPLYAITEDAAAPHLVGDIDRMTRLLGAPTVRFEQGVAEMVATSETVAPLSGAGHWWRG